MNLNQSYRQKFRNETIPNWYSGHLHASFNFSVLIFLVTFLASMTSNVTIPELLTIPLMLLVGNFVVFLVHRYPLHRSYPIIGKHTYKIHSQMHHQFFTHDAIVYESPRDFYILFFPATVVIGFSLVFLPTLFFVLGFFVNSNVRYLVLSTSVLYFLLFEIFHYVSHLDENHWCFEISFFCQSA